ncbi:MAG TPA: MFS transporter, partial [Caulobacteraceae bacterium]|nr:MFS transporter [Caulobacteraceae bacterium]
AERRGLALALFSLGVPFGMALGAYLGPAIAEAYNWRVAFYSIGGVGMVASILLFLFVREPVRGAMDVEPDVKHLEETPVIAHGARETFNQKLNQFFGRPMLLATAVPAGLSAFVGYALLNWTVPFLQREFGMAAYKDIALAYSLELAIAMGLGTWLSGHFVDILVKRSKIWYATLPAVALALSLPFFLGFVKAGNIWVALAFLAGPTFLNIMYLAPALALVQNSVKADQRTMAGAMLLLVLNLIGLGGGPTFIGIMSDHANADLLQQAGLTVEACRAAVKPEACGPASFHGLQMAFLWLAPVYVLAVIGQLIEAYFVRRELKEGPPSAARIASNARRFKLIVGFGGILVVLAAEWFLFKQPVTRDVAAMQAIFSGDKLNPQITNGLVRDLLMGLMLVIGIFGLVDVAQKPKPAAP